jgi:hypothetical protein
MLNPEKEQIAVLEPAIEEVTPEQLQEQKVNLIPPQYRGLPKEVVEELWLDPEYIDPQKNLEAKEKRAKALVQMEEEETNRETIKEQSLTNAYNALPDNRKNEFPSAQQDVERITTEAISGTHKLDNLTPEEELVINKLQTKYQEFKIKNPDKPFEVNFDNPIDTKVYNNLKYRLAFEELNQIISNHEQEKLNQVRKDLGMEPVSTEKPEVEGVKESPKIEVAPPQQEQENPEKLYGEFKIKNGETDEGAFWNEYSNLIIKKLKQEGKFKWGKERIYFDIPLDKMELMRDLAFKIAKENQIPIAFKYLDLNKSSPVTKNDIETTRFVTNFASVEDAKKFYEALSSADEYKNIKPDQMVNFHGLNLDGVAHYASGFREERVPLEHMIKTAIQNPDGTYTYFSQKPMKRADGTVGKIKIDLSKENFENFKAQYESSDPQKAWDDANKNNRE